MNTVIGANAAKTTIASDESRQFWSHMVLPSCHNKNKQYNINLKLKYCLQENKMHHVAKLLGTMAVVGGGEGEGLQLAIKLQLPRNCRTT